MEISPKPKVFVRW